MSAIIPPMAFAWDGEHMVPRHRSRANRLYVVGENYWLAPWEERSQVTHDHQFAWLAEAWSQLPENLMDQYPTPLHLRKRALIYAGYYDETIIDAGTKAAALRVAAAVQAIDEFAYVIVRGPMVVRRVAKSQSRRNMDKRTFQDSKQKILEIVSDLIGVSPEQLQAEAGKAA